jgi:hypothetical protein
MLVDLRKAESIVAASNEPDAVKNLRTRELKPLRELREACLFCYGMTECTGQKFWVAHTEAQDYDAVAMWTAGNTQSFAPIQIKEAPPHKLNPTASVEAVIESLQKYSDSKDLTVAIHLNQEIREFNPSTLRVPPLNIAALWIFGAVSPDKSRWAIWGNFLDQLQAGEFQYPT